MAFYQKLAKHTIYQIIARISSSGASFLITILIARHFGISSYGDYAKVTAFVTLFYLLADFGLNAVFLQQEEAVKRFRDLFYTRISLSFLLVVCVNVLAYLLPYNPSTSIGFSPLVRVGISIFSLTLITESSLFSAFAIFQRKMIYEKFMLATILGSTTTLIGVGVFVVLHLSLLWVFVAFVIGAIFEAVFSLLFTKERLWPMQVHLSFIKKLTKKTLPVMFMLLFNLIYFRIDMLLLSVFRPSSSVGIYDISYRVFDFLIALPLFLSNVLYPKLIADEKNSRTAASKLIAYEAVFLILGILVSVIFWFVSPVPFSLIKPELMPAVEPLHILLIFLPVFFLTNILQWILLAKKQQDFLAIVYLLLTVVNVFLNLIFIPNYGYVASAIITGICEVGVLLALWIKLHYD